MNIDFLNLDKKDATGKKYDNKVAKNFIKELQTDLLKHEDDLFTIDRFEGNYAVCENRKTKEMIDIPVTLIPKESKEGNIIQYKNGRYIVNKFETENAKNEIKKKVNELYKKKKQK